MRHDEKTLFVKKMSVSVDPRFSRNIARQIYLLANIKLETKYQKQNRKLYYLQKQIFILWITSIILCLFTRSAYNALHDTKILIIFGELLCKFYYMIFKIIELFLLLLVFVVHGLTEVFIDPFLSVFSDLRNEMDNPSPECIMLSF